MKPKDFFFAHIAVRLVGRLWWTQHFNGQVKRFKFVSTCLSEVQFTDVVETGTFLGNTTIALASLSDAKVHSIEINPQLFRAAKKRIDTHHKHLGIQLYRGSSDDVLVRLLKELNPDEHVLFLYLDAHWGANLPLFSEIDALNKWGGKFVAVVDDFQIVDDPGYGFDQYGDQIIGKNIIPLTDETKLYRLSAPSSTETGAQRGTGIVIHNRLIEEFSRILLSSISEIVS